MQPLPQLESCLRLAFDARGEPHVCGVSLGCWFVRAPTRGRRRSDLDAALLFPSEMSRRLGPGGDRAIAQAMDPACWRGSPSSRPTVPLATREWLAEAALAIGHAEGFALTWAMLRAISELEAVAQRLIGARMPRATVRLLLHGVGQRTLRVEPFAAFVVRVLKIAQATYAAFRLAGHAHDAAWEAVQDRLWAPHPTGRTSRSGEVRGAYLPSLLQAAAGHARKRLRRSAEEQRTRDHARTLLARFAAGPGARLWPWTDDAGRLLPPSDGALSPEMAGLCFFTLLSQAASERRSRGGPSGGLSAPLDEAGFGSAEWLPDRTDDLAIRLLTAGGVPRGELLEAVSLLLRATLSPRDARGAPDAVRKAGIDLRPAEVKSVLERARSRLPDLARWLEENGRDLLERA